MAFISLGTAGQLVLKVPTIGTTDWADTMRTDTFLKIAQHDHSGSGNGSQLGTGSILADAITGAKIRLDNDEYLKARNAADSANINIIKIGLTNHIELGAPFKNNTYITARDQADSSDLNVWKIDATDNLDFGTDVSRLIMKHDTYIQADNSGGTPIDLIKINTSNKLALGTDLANLAIINDTYLTGRNNADSAYINIAKVNTSDKIALGADLANAAIINNTYIQGRNNADSAYINIVKVNASDKLELGATVVSVSAETTNTSLIDALDSAVTLTDNVSATDAGIVTLSSGESCKILYRITRSTDIESGEISFRYGDTIPVREFYGDDTGVTFTVLSDALYYATTSTGSNGSMTYVIIKE